MQKEYITTNVRLPRGIHKELKYRALKEDRSLGALIREYIERCIKITLPVKRKVDYSRDPIWSLPKLARDLGDKNLSSKVDKIVYGV
ncbi:MAG: hypothetical protein AAB525_02515 [Patescibacteria group bacterium]